MWDIKPGDEVVCVDASDNDAYQAAPLHRLMPWKLNWLTEGGQYRVRWVGRYPVDGSPVIKLHGVPERSSRDWGFDLRRFRPVRKSRKGDGSAIEQLREIARRESMPTPIKTREKA